nr:MAG TPA: hypothetical protein [Caudoviricetes sp.]
MRKEDKINPYVSQRGDFLHVTTSHEHIIKLLIFKIFPKKRL